MAQIDEKTRQHIDKLLAVSRSRWEWLPEVATRFEDWHPDDQEAFVVEWALEEERLEDLGHYFEEGSMSGEQAAIYQDLKEIVAANRPIIQRLSDR